MESFDDERSNSVDTDAAMTTTAASEAVPPAAEVGADGFVSRAVADPVLVRFFGMRITTPATVTDFRPGEHGLHSGDDGSGRRGGSITLREALREFAATYGGGAKGGLAKAKKIGLSPCRVRWDDVEGLLFEPYDPTELLGNPPNTVSISSSREPAGAGGARLQEEEVCSCIRA